MSVTVLVVDDESVTRRVVAHALKSISVEVLDAEDGTTALQLAQANAPALALVDINLPDMDGFTVTQELRGIPHMADVPIVIFTARNHAGDEEAAAQAGAQGFFYKPFSTQELREMVNRYVNP
ncbi:MAG: response regulator [Chloroflexota bacterium]